MSNKETGGPAFPIVKYEAPVGGGGHMMTIIGGMTLRDYFAAKAVQGFIASPQFTAWSSKMYVEEAYEIADAMLQERNK